MSCLDCITSTLHLIFCCNPVPCKRYCKGEPQIPLVQKTIEIQQRQIPVNPLIEVGPVTQDHKALVAKLTGTNHSGLEGIMIPKPIATVNAQAKVRFEDE